MPREANIAKFCQKYEQIVNGRLIFELTNYDLMILYSLRVPKDTLE
jgi:hypothetical protein